MYTKNSVGKFLRRNVLKNRINEVIIRVKNPPIHTDVDHTGLFYTLLTSELLI